MTYALIENNKIVVYPLFEGDIRLRHSNMSFSFPFDPPPGYVRVEDTDLPSIDYTQYIEETLPVFTDGVWKKRFIVKPLPEEKIQEKIEEKWKSVRLIRDRLLTMSDWTQLGDSNVDKIAWAAYRQELRDIPSNTKNPFDVVWPKEPK